MGLCLPLHSLHKCFTQSSPFRNKRRHPPALQSKGRRSGGAVLPGVRGLPPRHYFQRPVGGGTMRYLYVLSVVGEAMATHMLDKGVEAATVDGWLLYWEDLIARTARLQPGQLSRHTEHFSSALKTAAWYLHEARSNEQ